MSIVGQALTAGGKPTLVGFAWHTANSTTYYVVAGSNSVLKGYASDSRYFTFSNGTFTCEMAGTYTVQYFGRGGYNSSGTSISLRYNIYAGGTLQASSTSVGNAGTSGSFSVTLAVGDTIYAQTSNSSGSNTHDFGYTIQPT